MLFDTSNKLAKYKVVIINEFMNIYIYIYIYIVLHDIGKKKDTSRFKIFFYLMVTWHCTFRHYI